MNDMVGFNPEVVVNFNKELNNLYEQSRNIYDYYVHNIYELITYSWYAPEAVEMDEYIKSSFLQVEGRMYSIDTMLRSQSRRALKEWCEATQTPYNYSLPDPDGFDWFAYKYNMATKEYENYNYPTFTDRKMLSKRFDGFVGVISENISIIAEHIKIYQNLTLEALGYYKELLARHESMFEGYSQMYNLETLFFDLNGRASNILSIVAANITGKMNETKEKYEQVARSNASMFSSGN